MRTALSRACTSVGIVTLNAGLLSGDAMSARSEEIRALYSDWMLAVRNKDVAELDRIVAPEFRYTDNIQGQKKRDVWMEGALAYEMTSFEFTNIDVIEYGQTAVAFVHYRQDGKLRGVSRSGDWLITDVWHRSENHMSGSGPQRDPKNSG